MLKEERMRTIEGNSESELEQKLLTPASQDNGIKADVVCCCFLPNPVFLDYGCYLETDIL